MLFWKTGSPGPAGAFDWSLGLAVTATIICAAVLSLLYMQLRVYPDFTVGPFSQCCYRLNTYVGMAVIPGVFGEDGVRRFGMIIVLAIPLINVTAVSTLIWFSGKSFNRKERSYLIVRELLSNPLILACILGFLYAQLLIPFPVFIENSFRLISSLTLPMALLSIGHSLETSKLKNYFGLAISSSAVKLVIMPVLGYFIMTALGVGGLSFKVGMICFSLPTATSIFILSSQLNSDVDLAAAGVVLSALMSAVSLSMALVLFAS
jgi:hypothetical protein